MLLLALYNFLALMAEWGVNFWLPTVLKETGCRSAWSGVLAALPYALGIVMMILVARSSDRRGERKWHMIAATACSGAFLLVRATCRAPWRCTRRCVPHLAIGSFLGRFGPFWTLPTEVLPPAVAGVGIGLINGAGNLGGTAGPWFFGLVRDTTGSFTLALTVAGVSLIVGGLVAIPIRVRSGGGGNCPDAAGGVTLKATTARRLSEETAMAEPERIDAGRAALIAYDVCRRALAPADPSRRATMRPVLNSWARIIAVARAVGVPVIYTTPVSRADGADAVMLPTDLSAETGVPPLTNAIEGSDDAGFPDEIAPRPEDFVFLKRRPSAFYGTGVAELLRMLRRDIVIIGGGATNRGVETSDRGF